MVNYISNIKRIDLKEENPELEGCYYCWAAIHPKITVHFYDFSVFPLVIKMSPI